MLFMKKLIGLIQTELPSPVAKQQDRFLGVGVAILLSAPFPLLMYHEPVIMVMFMVLGILYIAYALCSKSRIMKDGMEAHLFRVYDYTYVNRYAKTPSGMLMRSVGGDWRIKYHLAVSDRCGLPKLGSVISVYVPKSAKLESYGDRYYYPIVFGYETTERK